MAVAGEAPTLFLRKATGLVKGWSKFDAFLYSFMSVNFVTLGLFFALAVLGYVPGGQVLPAILISGVFITFLVITYAMLISVMPRAGGDYVWQSRVLGGGVSRCGCEDDFVAEGFEFGDEPLGFFRRVRAVGVEVGAEIGVGLAGGHERRRANGIARGPK